MPVNKCNHEQNRRKVCAPCGEKIFMVQKKENHFAISTSVEKLIKNFLQKNFSLADLKYPLSICSTCRNTLSEHDKGKMKRPFPIMLNYVGAVLLMNTRSKKTVVSEVLVCDDYICLKARCNSRINGPKGRGNKRTFSNIVDCQNTIFSKKNQAF